MMKTKFLLAAIALPLAFTACTSEDVIEQVGGQTNIENRALLGDVTFVGEGVDSRLSYEGAWAWEDGDKFSAHMIDAAKQWTAGDDLATNYIYSKDGEKYSTTSRMVEGLYWFYAPAKEDKVDRKLMSFELPIEQTMDVEDPEATIEAQEVFFSPVYKMEAKNNAANVNVPLTIRSYFSTALIPVKNAGTKTLNIKKIHVKTTNSLAYKGDISPALIAAKWTKIYKDGAWTDLKNEDGTALSANPMAENYVAANTNKKSSNVYMLTVDKSLEPGETFTANMLMPAGNAGVCKVTVILDNGQGFEITTPSLQFNHHAQKAVFGLTNNKPNVKSLKNPTDIDVDGYFVMSNDEIVSYLMSSSEAVKFTQVGDWALNADVINAISNYTADVEFSAAVTMESAATAITLKNLKNTAITLKSGALKIGDYAKDITVTGGELTLAGTSYANITNKGGKITVDAKNIVATSIANVKGELIFAKDNAIIASSNIVALSNGYYTSATDYAVGTLTINSGVTLTVKEAVVNAYKSTVNVNGKLHLATSGTGEFTNKGTLNVTGEAVADAGKHFDNSGSASVSGVLTNVENNGTIEATANTARVTLTTSTKAGVVNNTNLAYVAGATTNQTIYYLVSSAINNAGFKTLDAAIKGYGINTLKFTAPVSLNGALEANLTGVTKLIFSTGSNLVLGNGTKQSMDVKTIDIEDNVTFQGYSVANSGIGFQNGATINIAKGKKLTVNYMTIATAASTSVKIVLPYQKVDDYTTWAQVDNTNGQILIGTSGSVVKKDLGETTPAEAAFVPATDKVSVATTASTVNWVGAAPKSGNYTTAGTFVEGSAIW